MKHSSTAPPRIAVIGATGQLGSDIVTEARRAGYDVAALTHDDIELTSEERVRATLAEKRPELVINAAAMNHVEGCEDDPLKAFAVNAVGVRNLAVAARAASITLMHISTDYVFDGTKPDSYVETDIPGPVNVYGTSKLAGEYFVAAFQPRHYIVRTSALYGVNRCRAKPQDNFVKAMLAQGGAQTEVRVVASERVSPTSTASLSRQLLRMAGTNRYGIYHATSQGDCTWAEFASAIFEISGLSAQVIPVEAQPTRQVRRPANSVLANAALKQIGEDIMPEWREALKEYLQTLGAAA